MLKRTGFKKKPTKPMKRTSLRAKTPLRGATIVSKARKPIKTVKTTRGKKMGQKKALLEKYGLPQIIHSRWGTAKKPTNTDLLRGMLWTVFSRFIRNRDKDKPCISCGMICEVKQAGHFVPVGGSSVGTWFDEKNVHGECESCNAFDQFHLVPMRKNLIAIYGVEVVEDLERRRNQTTHLDEIDYINKIKYYLSLSTP